jgi:hypothetical protein
VVERAMTHRYDGVRMFREMSRNWKIQYESFAVKPLSDIQTNKQTNKRTNKQTNKQMFIGS